MPNDRKLYDVIIVGAGPSGLSCAIAAKKHRLKYLVIEKGCLVNSMFGMPVHMKFFSTPDLLEIGGIPFITSGEKPSRLELLRYYRAVTEYFDLAVNLGEEVLAISGSKGGFEVTTSKGKYSTKNIVLATGQFDRPNIIGIPGENLDKVSHYYSEPHAFYRKKVAVIGGKNSAVEASLELWRHGVEVTLIHRGADFGKSVKYWILPDIRNRIKNGEIIAYLNTVVQEVKPASIVIESHSGVRRELENDYVFALTGYLPDVEFFKKLGIRVERKHTPVHNPETLETNVPGIYVCGVITAGSEGSKVFIENSRHHGELIIGSIANGKNRRF